MSKTLRDLLYKLTKEDPDDVLDLLIYFGVDSEMLVHRFEDVLGEHMEDLEDYFNDDEEETY